MPGKYAQNHHVTANYHALFYNTDGPRNTTAVWLHAAGYRTALIGKYFNVFPKPARDTYIPPSWDYFVARANHSNIYYDFALIEEGKLVSYPASAGSYTTDVYAQKALAFLDGAVADEVPFFLELTPSAPHVPADFAPRHAGMFQTLTAPRLPSFNEEDVSDKPAYVRDRPPLSERTIAAIDENYRKRARSLQAVDEMVAAIVARLAAAGRLDNTYLVFISDNGWVYGQHRLRSKGLPYEEVIRMPLLVRGPGVPAGAVLDHLVGNADLAPTFAEWAGLPPPATCDGRSFAPLLRANAPPPEAWRQSYPIRFDPSADSEGESWPAWRGLRTATHTYVEYATGERELYDNVADPYQLDNLAAVADPGLMARLSGLNGALAGCKKAGCRALENAPAPDAGISGGGARKRPKGMR